MKTTEKPIKKNGRKVHVALSGGVDSAVSAFLLKQRGYDVTGVFMKNWSGEDYGLEDECPWKQDQRDAKSVCEHLGVPFKTYNFEKEYRRDIIRYFFDEYGKGRTPNPDILCNKLIKFGVFLDRALSEGTDHIATGHYAGKMVNDDGSADLMTAADRKKDQTYFLYQLTQNQLDRSIFPLASYTKKEVREIAKKAGLPVADKKDSQGICFLGRVDVREFLMKEIQPKPGNIIDIDTGGKVEEHDGIWFYTNGQREGLGIGGAGQPYYVCGKNISENVLYVAQGSDNPRLYAHSVKLSDIHWIHQKHTVKKVDAVVRYRQKKHRAKLTGGHLRFEDPVWLPSPGQSAVLYHGDIVLGGGVIE
jgi:tRNA-uridine 2-sulfurtransferase